MSSVSATAIRRRACNHSDCLDEGAESPPAWGSRVSVVVSRPLNCSPVTESTMSESLILDPFMETGSLGPLPRVMDSAEGRSQCSASAPALRTALRMAPWRVAGPVGPAHGVHSEPDGIPRRLLLEAQLGLGSETPHALFCRESADRDVGAEQQEGEGPTMRPGPGGGDPSSPLSQVFSRCSESVVWGAKYWDRGSVWCHQRGRCEDRKAR